MVRCFNGSILHVNLASGELIVEHPSEEFLSFLWGGWSNGGVLYSARDTSRKRSSRGREYSYLLHRFANGVAYFRSITPDH